MSQDRIAALSGAIVAMPLPDLEFSGKKLYY